MKSEYRLIFQGQPNSSEGDRAALLALLQAEFEIGKVFEVDDLVDNPPFVVKRSANRKELETESSKLRHVGAQTLIIETTRNAQRLAKQIQKDFVGSSEAVLPAPGVLGLFAKYSRGIARTLAALDSAPLETLAGELLAARERGSQIFVLGNGGSAAAASHLATDLAKQRFDDERYMFRVQSLADNLPWFSATANDFGYENVFTQQLKNLLLPNDVVIAISSSGNSPNVVRAVEYANKKGAKTFGIVGFDGGLLLRTAQTNIHIPTKKGQYGYMEDVTGIVSHVISIYLYEHDCALVKNSR